MKIKLSKSQWENIGKKTGWMKSAAALEPLDGFTTHDPSKTHWEGQNAEEGANIAHQKYQNQQFNALPDKLTNEVTSALIRSKISPQNIDISKSNSQIYITFSNTGGSDRHYSQQKLENAKQQIQNWVNSNIPNKPIVNIKLLPRTTLH